MNHCSQSIVTTMKLFILALVSIAPLAHSASLESTLAAERAAFAQCDNDGDSQLSWAEVEDCEVQTFHI